MKAVPIWLIAGVFAIVTVLTGCREAHAAVYSVRVDRAAHLKFGLTYPVTYKFRIPSGFSGLMAQRKHSDIEQWTNLAERKAGDLFNGVDAVRFDPRGGFAYISVRFNIDTDFLFLRVIDGFGRELDISFDSIPEYYDGRRAAVTITIDDYGTWSDASFKSAAEMLAVRGLHFSVGVITRQVSNWSLLQELVNRHREFMEIASHSTNHYCSADAYEGTGYENETVWSRDSLRSNLSFDTEPYIPVFIEPCGFSDAKLAAAVTNADYLVTRSVVAGYPVGAGFVPWDVQQGRYGMAPVVFNDYNRANDAGLLNEADTLFEATVAGEGIYHLLDHPALGLWKNGSYFARHLDYISGRSDLWYVPFGQLYQYHFIQEMRGNLSVQPFVAGTPMAGFSAFPQNGRAPMTVAFTDSSSGGITGWRWDFGDGHTSTERNPIHTYTSSGTFTATLVVTAGEQTSLPVNSTIAATIPYTVGISAIGNGNIACTPGTTADYMTRVSCTAFAGTGTRIANVTVDGVAQKITSYGSFTYDFADMTEDHGISATFIAITFPVSFVSGGNGTISGRISQSVEHGGSTDAVTAVPSNGYRFAGWSGPNGFFSTANPLVIPNVTAPFTVTASFMPDFHLVEFRSGGNGSLEGELLQTVVHEGSTTTVRAVAAEGYQFAGWTGTDGFASTANPLTVGSVASGMTITAVFERRTFPVIFTSAGNGTLSGETTQIVPSGGGSTAVRAVPAVGYRFVDWTAAGGFTSSDNPLVVQPITAAMAVTATFARMTRTVTPVAASGGSLTPNVPQVISYGDSARFTILPASGYVLAGVSGCGGRLAGYSYTTAPMTADCTVAATFEPIRHTITWQVAAGRGSISCPNPVVHGSPATCTIKPDDGFALSLLSDNGTAVTPAAATPTYVTGAVTEPHHLVATFVPASFTIVDAVRVQQQVLGKLQLSDTEKARLDVAPLGDDGRPKPDGVLGVPDIVIMLRKLVGALSW